MSRKVPMTSETRRSMHGGWAMVEKIQETRLENEAQGSSFTEKAIEEMLAYGKELLSPKEATPPAGSGQRPFPERPSPVKPWQAEEDEYEAEHQKQTLPQLEIIDAAQQSSTN